jgi:hypothetical protein
LRSHGAAMCGGGPAFVGCSGSWPGQPNTNSPGQIRFCPGSPSSGLRSGSDLGVRPRMPGCEMLSRKPKCSCPRSAPGRVFPTSEYSTFIEVLKNLSNSSERDVTDGRSGPVIKNTPSLRSRVGTHGSISAKGARRLGGAQFVEIQIDNRLQRFAGCRAPGRLRQLVESGSTLPPVRQ